MESEFCIKVQSELKNLFNEFNLIIILADYYMSFYDNIKSLEFGTLVRRDMYLPIPPSELFIDSAKIQIIHETERSLIYMDRGVGGRADRIVISPNMLKFDAWMKSNTYNCIQLCIKKQLHFRLYSYRQEASKLEAKMAHIDSLLI